MTARAEKGAVKRRVIAVPAVQCRRDNEDEVNAFLKRYTPRVRYTPNPYGGWQLLFTHAGVGKMDGLTRVWVGEWLVDIPETGMYARVSERKLRQLYRTRAVSDGGEPS